jgi:hypothetical protein
MAREVTPLADHGFSKNFGLRRGYANQKYRMKTYVQRSTEVAGIHVGVD